MLAFAVLHTFLQTRSTMLKLLKKLFQRDAAAPAAAAPRIRNATAAAKPSTAQRQPEAAPGVEVASLSLRAILERLPADLKASINQMPEADVKVILPVNAIMKQLPTGSVKMSLGSLYRQAPNGTFRKANVEDKRMIEVPLSEIFKTINPGRLHRRNDQRQYDVPDDVQGLFNGSTGRHVAPPAPSVPATPAPAQHLPQESAPEPRPALKMPGLPHSAAQNGKAANGHGASISPPTPTPARAPSAGAPLNLTGELTLLLVEIGATWPEGIRSELSVLTGDTKLVLPVAEVSAGLQKGRVAFTWAQVRNWLKPTPTSHINLADDTVLVLPLKIVAPAFVAATGAKKRETSAAINQSLPDFFGPSAGRAPTPAARPEPIIEPVAEPEPPALKLPEPPAPSPTPELPAVNEPTDNEARAENPRFSLAVEPDVPPLAMPLAEAPTAPVLPPPAATADFTAAPAIQADHSPITSLGQLFNQPGKMDWTPNELVRLTCGLPGVTGAVVALEEGLVVAQSLPDSLSSETFAAFMPQIFSRLDKYTNEMQLGENQEVTVITAGGPCRFFKRGKLFFATLGRAGENLPTALHVVADELASQNS